MIKKLAMLLVIFFLLFISSSCWDLIDIERRAYVIGISIDKTDKPDEIEVVFQIALPDAFASEGGGDIEAFWNIPIKCEDFIEARRALIRHINWVPTLEHCKILIFGEDFAKDGISEPLDFFIRSHDVRRLMQVAVVKGGKGKDIMELKLKNKRIPSMFISDLLAGNSKKNLGILDYSYIGILHEKYILKSSMPIARIILSEDKTLDVSGSGILDRNLKLIDWFSVKENMALSLLRGDTTLGFFSIDLPEELGKSIMINIFSVDSHLRPVFRGDTLYAVSRIEIEGDIIKIGQTGFQIKPDTIQKIEKSASKEIEKFIKGTYKKAQTKLKCDPFGLDAKVMNYYPEYWSTVNDRWDEEFTNTELDIQVKIKIRRIGDINY